MKYMLIGIKVNSITQDIQSTIEFQFSSYTEARMHQVVMEKEHSDMKFHVNFNTNYVSIDSLLSVLDKDSSNVPSNFN